MSEAISPDVISLAAVLVSALAATFVSKRLNLPSVVFLIFAGAIIGPNALGLVGQSGFIDTLAEIGAVLILFYVGIEFDFRKLLSVGTKAFTLAAIKMAILFVIVFEVGLLYGLDRITAAVAAFMLSITSTALMIRILEQNGLSKRKEVKLLVGQLIVEDVIAIVGITAISAINSSSVTLGQAIGSIAVSILVLGAAYFILRNLLERASNTLNLEKSTETTMFFSLSLCIALSVAAALLGLSPAIGAFLAGSLLSSIKAGHEAKKATGPLGLAFTSVFFVSIGMITNPTSILANLPLLALLIATFLIACFIAMYVASRTIGLDPMQATFSATSMMVLGEFSLLLAREASSVASIDLIGLASLGVLITAIASSAVVSRWEAICKTFEKIKPSDSATNLSGLFLYTSRLVETLELNGPLHNTLVKEVRDKKEDFKRIVFAGLFVVAARVFWPAGFRIPLGPINLTPFSITVIILLATIAFAGYRSLISLHTIAVLFEKRLGRKQGMGSFYSLMLAAFTLLIAAILLPIVAVDLLRLPSYFTLANIPLLVLSALFGFFALRRLRFLKTKRA